VITWLLRIFRKWNDLLSKCYVCGGETHSTDHDHIDYTLCEYSIRCKDCRAVVAYWAYGNWDGPTTRTEAFWFWLYFKKLKLKEFLGFK
jgi:hypothetical protein